MAMDVQLPSAVLLNNHRVCNMASGLLLDICFLIFTSCSFSTGPEDTSCQASGIAVCFCRSGKEKVIGTTSGTAVSQGGVAAARVDVGEVAMGQALLNCYDN